jgi:hypothetical protein
MNTFNALGFLLVGVVMKILPTIEHAHFRRLGPDGTSASATWFVCMGLILAGVGGVHLLTHHIWPSLKRLFSDRASPGGELQPQRAMR